jgi:ComF family protein
MLKNLINLLFPKLCKACEALLLEQEDHICSMCRHQLPLTNHHLNAKNETMMKFYGSIPLEFACSMLYFQKDGKVQRLIHALKYKNQQEIGTVLGNWYAPKLENLIKNSNVTHVIPVPLHKKRLKTRGYNQIFTFCLALSEALNIVLLEDYLLRIHYSDTQTKKNSTDRAKITEELFATSTHNTLENPHFLLVDDVITSGATLIACSKVLLKIPNAKISIVTIAYSTS